jgi:elongation factor P hydroxylase
MSKLKELSADSLALLKKQWRRPDGRVAVCQCNHPRIEYKDEVSEWYKCECGGWISRKRLEEMGANENLRTP